MSAFLTLFILMSILAGFAIYPGPITPLGLLVSLFLFSFFLGGKSGFSGVSRGMGKVARRTAKGTWKFAKREVYDKQAMRRGRLWGWQWVLITVGLLILLMTFTDGIHMADLDFLALWLVTVGI